MNMLHGQTGFGGGSSFSVSRNQKAKLAADYQELLKELSTPKIHSIGNYILGEDLGEGTYGKVKFATHRLTGQRVAIKIIPKTHAENLTREIHHHRHLHHPNIISLFEVIPTETTIYMVLEYCEGGELYDYLVRAGGRLKENLARKMFGQLCRAVKYCHDRRVVHRDLKLENILLDSQKNIKLGDFGFTRECEVKKLLETICGSTGYSAPEMLAGKKYSGPEADIWSLGVILYTLLCGALPFDDEDDGIMRLKIMKCEYEFEEIVSDEAKDLIGSILKKNPTERPTLKQILQHTWFTIKDHEDEDEDDDDQWDTSEDVGDGDSISSIEEVSDKGKKSDNRSATLIQFNYQNAVNHLERQRQELLTATKQSTDSIHLQTFTPHVNHVNHSSGKKSVPSAYKRFNDIQQQPMASSSSRILGPSTSSKASRRSSIDSKAFNEKVFFTTSEEKELLEKLESLGFNITEIKRSVLEGKCDSSSGLWWLLLNKMREKMKNENWHNAITMVDVAVGTSDEEIETPEEFEEEEESEIVVIETPETDSGRPSQESEDDKMVKVPKITRDILPPTPPPKTYHAAPASRERRKSLILSVPEAVEPVLTTITATASPPLSPKKYAGFTSPISSRSVSPIPTSPIPLSIPNTNKASHRKKLGLFSTIRGWWGGGSSHHPKDSGGGYKKSGLNWPDNGAVVPSDYARTSARPRANRKSGSRTPPNYDGNSDRRSSSISRNSVRDKKKKRNSLQGTKGRRSNQLSPLKIPPVTPSVVLSQNSPISMSPIPGTPPAKSRPIFTINRRKPFAYPTSSWGRKTVKRQSNGSLINILVDDFDEGSGSSDQNNTNNININDNSHQDPKDTFEKSAIENFSDDLQTTADKSKIDEQSKIIVESSKSKTITIASPTTPPFSLSSPLSNNKETEKLTKSLLIPLSTPQPSIEESTKVDASSSRIGITEVSSDGEDDSDVFVDANDFTSYAQVRSRSPSPSLSNSPCDASPVFESDGALLNPHSFLIRSSPIKISSTRLSTTPSIPFSPPLSPIDGSESMTNMPITRGQAMIEGLRSNKGKKPEAAATATVSPVDKTLSKSAFDLLSTPPDSPKLPPPRPSSPSSSKPAIPRLRHSKKASYPTPTSDFNVAGSDKNSKVTNNGLDIHDPQKENDQGGSSPPQSGPSINPSQRLFDLNNPNGRLAPRRPNNTKREASGINNPSNGLGSGRRPSLAKRPHGAIIEEEEEEEENEDMED